MSPVATGVVRVEGENKDQGRGIGGKGGGGSSWGIDGVDFAIVARWAPLQQLATQSSFDWSAGHAWRERERERERERVEGIDALQSIKTRWQSADDCDIVADPRDRQKKTTKNKTHTLDFFFFGPPLFFDVFFIFFFSIFLPEMCVSIFLFEFLHNFRFPFFFWFLVCLFVCLFSWCACPLVPRQSIRRGVGKSKPSREKKNKRDPLPFCSMAANQRTGNLTDLTRDGEMKKSLEPSLQRIADSGLIKKPVRGSVKKKEKKKQKKTFLFSFPSNDILPLRIVIWEKKRRKFQSS